MATANHVSCGCGRSGSGICGTANRRVRELVLNHVRRCREPQTVQSVVEAIAGTRGRSSWKRTSRPTSTASSGSASSRCRPAPGDGARWGGSCTGVDERSRILRL